MSAPPHLRLVVHREVTERLRSPSLLASTLFLLVVSALGALLLSHTTSRTHRLAVVGAMPAGLADTVAQMAAEMDRTSIELSTVPDAAAGRAQLLAGRLDAVAVDATHLIVLNDDKVDDGSLVFRALRRAEIAQHLRDAGVPDADVTRLLAAADVRRLVGAGVAPAEAQSMVSPGPNAHADLTVLRPLSVGSGVAVLGTIVVVFYLFGYGTWIAQGVAEETSGGVSNIIMATCPPARFLVGKTLGAGVVALIQGIVLALPTLGLLVARARGVPVTAATVLSTVLWFVLAFAIYGLLFAALGARARKVEKMMGTTVWVVVPMVGLALAGGYVVLRDPGGPLAAVLSFFPLSAPFTMPARAAALHLGWWEVPVAAAGTVAGAAAAAWAGARIYVRGLGRA